MGIVEEFEKTISQLISEKERESVCNVIARERWAETNYAIIEHHQSFPGCKQRGLRSWRTSRLLNEPSTTSIESMRGPRRLWLGSSPTKTSLNEQWRT